MDENIYGLIFDVDGIIADTESLSSTVTAKVLLNLFGIDNVQHNDFNAGRGCGAEAYIRAAAEVHGVSLTMKQVLHAEEVREANMLEHLKQSPLPAYPGVLNLVNSGLNDPCFRLAIATSSSRTKSKEVLTSAGVPYDKMAYVTGSDVENKKPDPELFLTAAKQINIAPEKCLVVEDAPSGIEAAVNAGCKCVAVTNSFDADKLQKADMIVGSLEEISISDVASLIKD